MSDDYYPEQVDCVWLASGAHGYLAAFITAGVGPIPPSTLLVIGERIEELEDEILSSLPVVATAHITRVVPNISSYEELAKRGLYVYDWTDVSQVEADQDKSYKLVARPSTPARLTDIDGKFGLELVYSLKDVDFGSSQSVFI